LTKLVEVEWQDISTNNVGWQSPEAAIASATPVTVRTVGYVLAETREYLKLAMLQTEAGQNEIGVTAVIPRGVIKRIKVLKGLS
jgi:hypothetical protein